MTDNLAGHIRQDILQGLLGGIGDGVILTDCEERVTYANRAALKILRLPSLTGNEFFDDICPLVNLDNGKPFPCPISTAITEDRSVGLARNTGFFCEEQAVYLSLTCSPMRDETGVIAGCSVIMRDITRIRRMEMKIETDHHHLRAVFAAAKIGLCIMDTSGKIMEVNDAAAEIMSVDAQTAIGMQFGDALSCENSLMKGCGHSGNCRHCPVRKNLEAAIMDDNYSNEFTVALQSCKSGDPLWLKVFVSQTWAENVKQIIVAMIDESARKLREHALEQAREAAEATMRAKDQFMANMSHEIRTPINGLNGMIDLTLRTPLTPEQRENLVGARQCSEDLLAIINDILDFSKLESGRMTIEHIPVHLPELIRQICTLHSATAANKGLDFVGSAMDNLPQYIKGDPLRLRQILNNLLNNAIKFTPTGSVALSVTAQGDWLELTVSDTGIGISEDGRRKLFRPFSQVDGSITRRFGGTGLGLMIVKQLTELMGGHIDLTSEEGSGSTFSVHLPLILVEKPLSGVRDRRVFVKPEDIRSVKSIGVAESSDPDIAALLSYCEQKLSGE